MSMLNLKDESGPYKPDPDPHDFKVLNVLCDGDFCLAQVLYPRSKQNIHLMVFKGVTEQELRDLTFLDPSFGEGRFSPIARFNSSQAGRDAAISFMKHINLGA